MIARRGVAALGTALLGVVTAACGHGRAVSPQASPTPTPAAPEPAPPTMPAPAPTPPPDDVRQEGWASFYGSELAGRRTANGERYDPSRLTAAHRRLPFGTCLDVTRLDSGQRVTVRINDRGPFVRGRIIDLSEGAARRLHMVSRGVIRVRLERCSDEARREDGRARPSGRASRERG